MAAKKKPVQPTTAGPEVIVPADTPKAKGTCNAVTGTHMIDGVLHERRCSDHLQTANNGSLKDQLACPTHNWRNFVEKARGKTQSEKALERLVGAPEVTLDPKVTGTVSDKIIGSIINRQPIPPRASSDVDPRPSFELAERGVGGTIENPLPSVVQAHNEAVAAPNHSVDYIGSTGGSNGVPGTNPGRINPGTSTLADYQHWASTNGHHIHFADEPCSAIESGSGKSACENLRPTTRDSLVFETNRAGQRFSRGVDSRHPFVKKLLGIQPETPMLDDRRNLIIHTDHRTPQQRDFDHPSYVDPIHSSDSVSLLSTTALPWFPSTGQGSRVNAPGAKGAVALPSTPKINIPEATDGIAPGKIASVHPGLLMRQAHGLQAHVGRPQLDCPTCVEDSHKEDHGWGQHALAPEQGCPLC
jgi:hypothetical protein